MLIQMLIHQPRMIGPVLAATPVWVWFLLAGLLWLGTSMLKGSTIGARRAAIMPVAMTGLSVWGTVSAFGHSVIFGYVLLAWVLAAVVLAAVVASLQAPKGTRYNPQDRSFTVPGSWVPLALIMGIFLVKYVVGVEVAMNPSLSQDASYSLAYGVIYGAFSGIFTGRSLRLARLAMRNAPRNSAPAVQA